MRAISSILQIVITLLAALMLTPASAVENTGATPFLTTVPTVSGWTCGWGRSDITGWDYVGQTDGGPSGVYMGHGWVLTAGHVGISNMTIDGTKYLYVPNSGVEITANNAPVDLYLFRLQTYPDFPPLIIRSSDPLAAYGYNPATQSYTYSNPASPVVMIGFGGGKSWGYDSVNYKNNYPTDLSANQNYVSNDFITWLTNYTTSFPTITNTAYLVSGDSGGGDFIYNSTTSQWELAGINEGVGPALGPPPLTQYSFMVQLNTYADQINAIVCPCESSPTMPDAGLVLMGCLLFFAASRSLGLSVSSHTKHRNTDCPD